MLRRGQITLFIILGILMLFVVLAGIYLLMRSAEGPKEAGSLQEVVEPTQVKEIRDYVQQCLADYSAQGIDLLGIQGGYVYVPADAESLSVENDEGKKVIVEGDAVRVMEEPGTNEVPYWLTKDSIAVPSTDFMETQLERYLDWGILRCVDFTVFEREGYEVTTKDLKVDVGIGKQVVVDVNWPTTVRYGDKRFEFENYNYVVPVNLGLIHSTAMDLVIYELAYTYLEDHLKSLVALYGYAGGQKDVDKLPPLSFAGTNTDCSYVTWTKSEVADKLEDIWQDNIGHLKMAETNFERFEADDPIAQGVYDSFIRHYFGELPSIRIDFRSSPSWNMLFDISPSAGTLVRPERHSQTGIPFLAQLCVFEYKFKYSVQNPVLVKITDSESARIRGKTYERNKGFDFYFPMQLFLCGNQNRQCTGRPAFHDVNISDIFGPDIESHIYDCNDLAEEISLTTYDDKGVLAEVDVTHLCEGYLNDCYLGRTDSNGKLTVKAPRCDNPILRLEKHGYALLEDAVKDEYHLEVLREYTVDVQLVHARSFLTNYYLTSGFTGSSCGKSAEDLLLETRYELREKNDVTIRLEGGSLETPVLIYPIMDTMKLASGTYDVTTLLMGEVVIKPSVYKTNGDYITIDFDGDPSTHENYEGPWLLGTNNFVWDLSKEELQGDNVRFYALVEHLSDEDLEVKSFDDPIIQDDMLSGNISVDVNCDGNLETQSFSIDEQDYLRFIVPEFS